ncbi:hypothetical protein [Alteromonas stellipolaris]|uniref:Uncharacterized protein n=1 Tax=Alteromonas stellipolaris TaxID=233316 RepID=A0AAW7Z7N9_9ALTE|nr:hypothetical protein [Alteromonas stellipolaris]MDO6579644.1 hypothetical protein [Alteromonas stellipolaris]MDP2538085.1 hypothetical protein [Alteromonas stellipolaris]
MKAGDIIATINNKFIKGATFGDWSHVGIAIDEKFILEAIPSGVVKTEAAKIVSESKKTLLLSRPEPLTDKQKSKLLAKTEELLGQNIKYSKSRTAYSGTAHIFNNIFKFLAFIMLMSSCVSFFIHNSIEKSYPLLLLSVVSAFIGIPIAKSTGTVRQTNRFLKKYKLLKWLQTDMEKMFFSQLVEDVDLHIGGNLSGFMARYYELRPKDIVNACISLQWPEKVITKQ